MSLDAPTNDKMMSSAPKKKEFHFPATATHYAEFVEAESIDAAEKVYHTIKRLLPGIEQAAGVPAPKPVDPSVAGGEQITKPSE